MATRIGARTAPTESKRERERTSGRPRLPESFARSGNSADASGRHSYRCNGKPTLSAIGSNGRCSVSRSRDGSRFRERSSVTRSLRVGIGPDRNVYVQAVVTLFNHYARDNLIWLVRECTHARRNRLLQHTADIVYRGNPSGFAYRRFELRGEFVRRWHRCLARG